MVQQLGSVKGGMSGQEEGEQEESFPRKLAAIWEMMLSTCQAGARHGTTVSKASEISVKMSKQPLSQGVSWKPMENMWSSIFLH